MDLFGPNMPEFLKCIVGTSRDATIRLLEPTVWVLVSMNYPDLAAVAT
jgi:hypothetical protein